MRDGIRKLKEDYPGTFIASRDGVLEGNPSGQYWLEERDFTAPTVFKTRLTH